MFKEFNGSENRTVRRHCSYSGLYQGASHRYFKLEYRIPDHSPTFFCNLSGSDAYPFIKKLEKTFRKENIGVTAEYKGKHISFGEVGKDDQESQ